MCDSIRPEMHNNSASYWSRPGRLIITAPCNKQTNITTIQSFAASHDFFFLSNFQYCGESSFLKQGVLRIISAPSWNLNFSVLHQKQNSWPCGARWHRGTESPEKCSCLSHARGHLRTFWPNKNFSFSCFLRHSEFSLRFLLFFWGWAWFRLKIT